MTKKAHKHDVFFMLRRYVEQATLHVLRTLSAPELVPAKAAVRRTRAPRRKK